MTLINWEKYCNQYPLFLEFQQVLINTVLLLAQILKHLNNSSKYTPRGSFSHQKG